MDSRISQAKSRRKKQPASTTEIPARIPSLSELAKPLSKTNFLPDLSSYIVPFRRVIE
jgi:hypothetical protein